MESNPFAALFNSTKDVEDFKQQQETAQGGDAQDKRVCSEPTKESTVLLLEKLLLVSTRSLPPKFSHVHLSDSSPLDVDSIDMVLFERLLSPEPQTMIRNLNPNPNFKEERPEIVGRAEVVFYLFDVYERCWKMRRKENGSVAEKVMLSVLTNLSTALEQPEVYFGQDPHQQLQNLILEQLPSSDAMASLLDRLLQKVCQPDNPYAAIFTKVLDEATKRLDACTLMSIEWDMVEIVSYFAASPNLALLLLKSKGFSDRSQGKSGRHFQLSILGSLLSISCLPRSLGKPYEFFDKPSSQSSQVHKSTEASIGVALKALHSRLHKIFLSLLKVSPSVKDAFLKWLEECLSANSGRAGLWHLQAGELQALSYVSDSFMINLGAVMLMLASPFINDVVQPEPKDYKIMKVDPTYCSSSALAKKQQIRGLYCGDLPQQTPLLPRSQEEEEEVEGMTPPQYSFTTSCFFLTHRALHLGIQVVHQKLHKISQELGRLHHEYQEGLGEGDPAREMLRQHMETRTTRLLSLKAAAFENETTERLLQFLAATSIWLTQIATRSDHQTPHSPSTSALYLSFREITLGDLQKEGTGNAVPLLRHIPEFLVETLVGSVIAINRYSKESLALCEKRVYHHLLGFIAVFMGSSQWMSNPHLRARLAECLETLIPSESESSGLMAISHQKLLMEHSLSPHLVTAIIHVFVHIEMTGESVAFEEKFNYRRPMYEVMKYFWNVPSYQKEFILLAEYALMHMESAKPPLFLRFVNLLINDAIFLLDEGLSYMSQLRELQIQRTQSDWQELTAQQRAEREGSMRELSLNARFHNMLGSRTLEMLVRLTEKIPDLFIHSTLVGRMTAMLNHFLQHLVGPQQRNLKVRDMEKYEFRPGESVSEICVIYANLSKSDAFCLAVSADGRSYSPELFAQAANVLNRIGKIQLSDDIQRVGEKVKEANQRREEAEDLTASAPEEFLDPIMLHLMSDPVTLPSSGVVVDKQTIARHLLSDQNDPFNRQPLTMEEVLPNEELKLRIQEWLRQRRQNRLPKPESNP